MAGSFFHTVAQSIRKQTEVSKTLQKYRRVSEKLHNEDFYENPFRQVRDQYSEFVPEFSQSAP